MTGEALRAASSETRVTWLSAAAERLLRETIEAREALSKSTGLSAPMVEWGVRSTLRTIEPGALRALAEQAHAVGGAPISSLSIVLAGNLFTAAVRAVVVPLLLGIPVTVKASSRETLFPRMLLDALRSCDSHLGKAMNLMTFARGDVQMERALLAGTEATAVYGSDNTIDAIARRHPNANLIAHGHGISAACCGPEALLEDRISETIACLALDVCAYDQRGCLSPQVVYVVVDSETAAREFAERLARSGLDVLARKLPRGPLPLEVGAAQAQWRGIAEVQGSLIVGGTYGIAIGSPATLRWSPGYRNVTIAPLRDLAEAVRALEPLGASLKCVGVDSTSAARLRQALDRSDRLTAYACALGEMQTPALDAPADGKPIWHGLLR
jgi:acyl-CoA reductase-like NAD-dependent aldehyde dehydrogenase